MGGATIIPRSPKIGQKIFFKYKSYMTLKYLLLIDFPYFDPLTAAEMALCVNLGPKCIPKTFGINSHGTVPLSSVESFRLSVSPLENSVRERPLVK